MGNRKHNVCVDMNSTPRILITQKMARAIAANVERFTRADIGDRMRRPKLAVGVIAKNESRDLPRALRSVMPIMDYLIVVDTGSTDDTVDIARQFGAIVFGAIVETYTDASKQDANGNWMLTDFSRPRNRAIELAEATEATWYLWLDADDVLITPDAVRRWLYRDDLDCLGMWIDGGNRWVQHRVIRLSKGARFEGRCHEYLKLDGLRIGQIDDSLITHWADPTPGESSNARNLRILMEEWTEKQTTRTAFYIANTHKDGGRHKESAEWYLRRITMEVGYRDEWLFAILYRARSLRAFGDFRDADAACKHGMDEAPDWAEFPMERAFIAYAQKEYLAAIDWATPCLIMKPPPTSLWREHPMYNDQPARLISWCHEHMGNFGQALTWAEEAQRRIGGPDIEWEVRIANLRSLSAPKHVETTAERICVRRPGAIGDVLMTLNLLPALREANPGRQIFYFTSPQLAAPDALGEIIRQAGADQVMHADQFEAWGAKSYKAIDLVGYPLAEGYPEKPMRKHLLEYFADELGLIVPVPNATWLPSLTLRRPKRIQRPTFLPDFPYATIQRKAGWSKYKEWPQDRWQKVMLACADMGIDLWPIGAEEGLTLSQSIAVFANAQMHIGIDSFCNHLTNYHWEDANGNGRRVPGVILWGSTQATAAGYDHNINLSAGLACQPCFRENPSISRMHRGPCINPPRATYDDDTNWACMDSISVNQVVKAISQLAGPLSWSA